MCIITSLSRSSHVIAVTRTRNFYPISRRAFRPIADVIVVLTIEDFNRPSFDYRARIATPRTYNVHTYIFIFSRSLRARRTNRHCWCPGLLVGRCGVRKSNTFRPNIIRYARSVRDVAGQSSVVSRGFVFEVSSEFLVKIR